MEEKKKIHQRASSSFSRKRRINYTRENLKTHRNDFVDRFLRRIRLGDDLDASKLGSECKHDDVRERYILFVRDEGHVAPTKNQKETRSLRLKRDEEISFSLFTTKRKEFLATTHRREEGQREKRDTKRRNKKSKTQHHPTVRNTHKTHNDTEIQTILFYRVARPTF